MSELKRSVLVAAVVVAMTAAITATLRHQERLQHLAIPTVHTPTAAPPAEPVKLVEVSTGTPEVLVELGRRISAIERDEHGNLWIGLFDQGLVRVAPGATLPQVVATRPGRERFVSDVLVDGDRVYAATFAGVLEVNGAGERVRLHVEGVGVEALARVGKQVFAGTAKGLYVRAPSGGFAPVDSGAERPRVTAMTAVGDRLWMATSRGVYVAEFPAPAGPVKVHWIPLVFGAPGASTNVAMAIAPDGQGGVVVGTDDGGLVRISGDGKVASVSFEDARANEINPGAAVAFGGGVAFGTQGGGVLLADEAEPVRRWAKGAAVSAVAVQDDSLLVGTATGMVLRVELRGEGETRTAAWDGRDDV